jgi:hypothetical protein
MLKTSASLQGVSILSRDAQKKINVGVAVSGVCQVRVSGGTDGGAYGILNFGPQSSGSAVSAAAANWCAEYIAQNGGRWQYDCAYDGYTASWA